MFCLPPPSLALRVYLLFFGGGGDFVLVLGNGDWFIDFVRNKRTFVTTV